MRKMAACLLVWQDFEHECNQFVMRRVVFENLHSHFRAFLTRQDVCGFTLHNLKKIIIKNNCSALQNVQLCSVSVLPSQTTLHLFPSSS